MIIYLAVHAITFFICLGFTCQKADSSFIKDDRAWWCFSITIITCFAPISFLMILGAKLHGQGE